MNNPCKHCGEEASPGEEFCCRGCAAAWHLIRDMGLERYYQARVLSNDAPQLKPDEEHDIPNLSRYVQPEGNETYALYLMVEGIHCAACIWLIESMLQRQEGVAYARLNMSTRRLTLRWKGQAEQGQELVRTVCRLGYRLVPYDPERLQGFDERKEKQLLRALAIAGFAAGNVMLISVVLWSSSAETMGMATRTFFHWLSALIAMPVVAYSGRVFFTSAWKAIRHGHTNMDVPISLALILATGMSLAETIRGGLHVYFDSSIMLLFFLLIGRYLDLRSRGRARSVAESLLHLRATAATLLREDGTVEIIPAEDVKPGAILLIAAGEKIAADGEVIKGQSELDTSLVTGESIPQDIKEGGRVFAGTVNLSAPLQVRVQHCGEGTLLAEIVRLMEQAEQGQAGYVRLADRIAAAYTPVVHVLALGTFLGWWLVAGTDWQPALLHAVTVLIITCPCALALAVPVVQVLAIGRLLRQGIIVKSGDALERLADIDTIVFDKTGTLTEGHPVLQNAEEIDRDTFQLAASLAAQSKHPLSRAIKQAWDGEILSLNAEEVPGCGLKALTNAGEARLGKSTWCGADDKNINQQAMALWFVENGKPPVYFLFEDSPREDAAQITKVLREENNRLYILSGDRKVVVSALASQLGIEHWQAEVSPAQKCEELEKLRMDGRQVLMIGDGLNDAAALAAANVSMSPSSALDIAQNAADIVFQGTRLQPVQEALQVARKAQQLVRQNFILAFLYNAIAVPVAVLGLVTPLVAALAMSGSSLLVIGNAMRLTKGEG